MADSLPLSLFEDAPTVVIGVNGKKCSGKCGQAKRYSEFFKSNQGDGYYSYCKQCSKDHNREFYRKNPKSPEEQKKGSLRRAYNLTVEEYRAMFASQNGLCASCGNPETKIDHRTGNVKELAVDHDHATGKIRALLCNACNVALGLLQDDPERIEQLFRYIQRYTSQCTMKPQSYANR